MSKYLYNDVELPALPEWTKEYQYVAVFGTHVMSAFSAYIVVAQSTPIFYHDLDIEDCTEQGFHFEAGHSHSTIAYLNLDGFLEKWNTQNVSEEVGHEIYSFRWSNHDIISLNNNSVLVKASDPVPVPDEPEQPDEPETVLSWQKHDAYKPNTEWDGNTFYRVMGGKWVKQGGVVPAEKLPEPDVPSEVVIEWDGDTTGKVTAQSGTFNLVKVSDLTPTYNDLVGAVITAGAETITITEDMLGVSPQDVFVSLLDGMFVSVYDFGLDLPFTELGFYANIEVGAFKLTYTPKS